MSHVTMQARRLRRRRRVRAKVAGTAERPRLAVFRSNRGVFVQVIDDEAGRTLAAAQWTEPEVRDLPRTEQATRIGALIAERAKSAGVQRVVFDRGGYQYHGRVQAVADGAREAGLEI